MNFFLMTGAAQEAAATGGLVEQFAQLLQNFGWHKELFIAQVINFILVVIVLKKFAFGPVQKMLHERRLRIEEGEANLLKIEKQLAESEQNAAQAIAQANAEAQRLVEEAKTSAANLSEQKSQEAIAQAQQILAKAQLAAKAEREEIAAELKREFGRLVTATTAQVTGKVLNDEDQRRINSEAATKVEA